MVIGTDLARIGDPGLNEWRDYNIEITPSGRTSNYWWNWGFIDMLPKANIIISNVQSATTISQDDKNAIEAEARFFRAFAYNALVNMFGGVPIVDRYISEPKNDFVRASKDEVYTFAQKDLEFAVQHLPATAAQRGRITKAAANHLLSEVNISLKQWDKAIAAASAVIDNPAISSCSKMSVLANTGTAQVPTFSGTCSAKETITAVPIKKPSGSINWSLVRLAVPLQQESW
jgi:hypothetical protein